MSNFTWIVTKKREQLLSALESIPEFGKKSKSLLMEMAMDEFILKHGKSNNPQTTISLFEDQMVKAIPSIYEYSASPWDKFYSLLNEEEYEELGKQLMWIMTRHNKEGKRFQ